MFIAWWFVEPRAPTERNVVLLLMIGGQVHFAPDGARLFKFAASYKHFAPTEQERILQKLHLKVVTNNMEADD